MTARAGTLPLVPSRRLVLAASVPVFLALSALLDETLLWPMLATDALLLLVAGVDAFLGRSAWVTVEREAPEVFSVGRPNPVTLEIRSRCRRSLRVSITDDLFPDAHSEELPAQVQVPARGHASLRYRIRPGRRGAYVLGDHHVRYPTPLGLFARQLCIPAQKPIKVYPDVQAVRTYDLLAKQDREQALVRASRMRGGESEFERLRDYGKDDEFRSIDWKASARRQKLIAREYQMERNQNILFMLDCGRLMTAEILGLSCLDHALNATLMLSHVAARAGDHVGLLAFNDQVRSYLAPTTGPRASQRIIQASYDVHASIVESSYAAAFDQVALRLRKRALVVLFTQVVDDEARKALLKRMAALLPRHLPLCVIFRDVEVDELLEPGAASSARAPETEADLYIRGAAAEIVSWRDRLVRDLKTGGALVLDVAPQRLTASLINRYLEIKARHLL